jgi:23S rRNA (uracil1939-C5)-methyltransferase
MDEYGVTAYDEMNGKGLVRHILIRTGYETGEIQVCLVINGEEIEADDLMKSWIMPMFMAEKRP